MLKRENWIDGIHTSEYIKISDEEFRQLEDTVRSLKKLKTEVDALRGENDEFLYLLGDDVGGDPEGCLYILEDQEELKTMRDLMGESDRMVVTIPSTKSRQKNQLLDEIKQNVKKLEDEATKELVKLRKKQHRKIKQRRASDSTFSPVSSDLTTQPCSQESCLFSYTH